MKPLKTTNPKLESVRSLAALDALWSVGFVLGLSPCPMWSGFMKVAVNSDRFERTRVEILPFINMDPSDPSTIYTALCFAKEQCERSELRVCSVTFDQPMYLKASEIVATNQELKNVTLRHGGFHLLLPYLGSIGFIVRKWLVSAMGNCVC